MTDSPPPDGTAYFQLDGTDSGGAASGGAAGGAPAAAGGDKIHVQFNPASLRITLTNQFGQDPPEQHARATTAKLDVELVFDTTEDGSDVRVQTQKIFALAIAKGSAPQKGAAPKSGGAAKGAGGSGDDQANFSLPKVRFCWGSMSHVGVIESLTETLDYWSSDGVPLRATLQVGMKGAADDKPKFADTAGLYKKGNPLPPQVSVTPVAVPPSGTGATGAAGAGGDPDAGRFLAATNGLENMRAPMGATMGAAASVNLSAAAGFSMSAGAGIGFGASAGIGASAGFGASASAGFAIGAGAGASAAAGLSASVGIGMSAGAGFGVSAGGGFGASAGIGFGASAGVGFGASAGAGFGASAGAGFGASAGAGFGAAAGVGFGASTSAGFGAAAGAGFSTSTSMTGFDGVTRTETSTTSFGVSGMQSRTTISVSSGGASAGIAASEGAFAGLGMSKTTLPSGSFNPDRFLPPPRPAVGAGARFDETGRLVSSDGMVAASWQTSSVTFF